MLAHLFSVQTETESLCVWGETPPPPLTFKSVICLSHLSVSHLSVCQSPSLRSLLTVKWTGQEVVWSFSVRSLRFRWRWSSGGRRAETSSCPVTTPTSPSRWALTLQVTHSGAQRCTWLTVAICLHSRGAVPWNSSSLVGCRSRGRSHRTQEPIAASLVTTWGVCQPLLYWEYWEQVRHTDQHTDRWCTW